MIKLILTTIAMFIYTLGCGLAIVAADEVKSYELIAAIIGGCWLPVAALWYSINQPEPKYLPKKEVCHGQD